MLQVPGFSAGRDRPPDEVPAHRLQFALIGSKVEIHPGFSSLLINRPGGRATVPSISPTIIASQSTDGDYSVELQALLTDQERVPKAKVASQK